SLAYRIPVLRSSRCGGPTEEPGWCCRASSGPTTNRDRPTPCPTRAGCATFASKWTTSRRLSTGWLRTVTAWPVASVSTSTSGAWRTSAGRRESSWPWPSEPGRHKTVLLTRTAPLWVCSLRGRSRAPVLDIPPDISWRTSQSILRSAHDDMRAVPGKDDRDIARCAVPGDVGQAGHVAGQQFLTDRSVQNLGDLVRCTVSPPVVVHGPSTRIVLVGRRSAATGR